MTRSTLFLAATLAAACQRGADHTERFDRIDQQLAAIQTALRNLPAARGPQPRGSDRPRPDPAVTYAIPIDGAPARGADDALVTVVEAFEFACPACESARPVVDQLLAAYPDDVRVVYKHYIVHPPVATIPAHAACAAHAQGKFAEMAEQIWERGYKANRNLAAPHMEKLAADIGLDAGRFRADMNGDACARRVREDQAQMARVGAPGTPTFFVNGRHVQRRSIEEFRRLIDQELAVARQRVAQGTRPADYYKTWIVDKGARAL